MWPAPSLPPPMRPRLAPPASFNHNRMTHDQWAQYTAKVMAYYQARDAVPKDTVGPDYFEARHEESDNDDDYDDDDEPVEICDKKRFDGDEV